MRDDAEPRAGSRAPHFHTANSAGAARAERDLASPAAFLHRQRGAAAQPPLTARCFGSQQHRSDPPSHCVMEPLHLRNRRDDL